MVSADLSLVQHQPANASSSRRSPLRWLRDNVMLLLLLPNVALLILMLGLPLAVVAWTSLQPNVLLSFQGPGIENYQYLFSKAYYVNTIIRTISIASLTTIIALPLGYLAALLLRNLTGQLGNLAIMGLTFPILTGPLVVVLGWMALLPDGGPVFSPLIRWGLIAPPKLLGTQGAIIVSLVQFTLPFAVLTLYTSLRQIPHQLYEAAQNLGASETRAFLHVTLPLSLHGVLSAAIITFSLAGSSYVSPYYLGGASQLTLTTLIAQFIIATYNDAMAAASAVVLLVIMAVVLLVLTKIIGRMIRA